MFHLLGKHEPSGVTRQIIPEAARKQFQGIIHRVDRVVRIRRIVHRLHNLCRDILKRLRDYEAGRFVLHDLAVLVHHRLHHVTKNARGGERKFSRRTDVRAKDAITIFEGMGSREQSNAVITSFRETVIENRCRVVFFDLKVTLAKGPRGALNEIELAIVD